MAKSCYHMLAMQWYRISGWIRAAKQSGHFNMATVLVVGVTIAYFLASIGYFRQKQYPQAIMLFGYSFANIGFIWTVFK